MRVVVHMVGDKNFKTLVEVDLPISWQWEN